MPFQGGSKPTNSNTSPENGEAQRETVLRSLHQLIDHTLLKQDATRSDIERVCKEARDHKFATVCVNSSRIPLVAELLKGSTTLPIAVVGFPLGAALTSSKVFETQEAVRLGAREIDMVINVGALKDFDDKFVQEDIRAVVEAAKPYPVKVILETSLLNSDEKVRACKLAKAAQAAFVKTSTGFTSSGATVEDIQLMRETVGSEMGVKASGGVRTTEDALKMLQAGANRIGASSSVAIVTGGTQNQGSGY
jgi:deoxyribose-phosphate aldolase